MQRHEKLQIAKWAFRDISQAIEKWQNYPHPKDGIAIDANWDGKITVDDETFTAFELREKELECPKI